MQEVESAAREYVHDWTPGKILEPCVGGGAWIRAAREQWPTAVVDRADIDGGAPGLSYDLRPAEDALQGDFLQLSHPTRSPRHMYDAVIGNPPYKGDPLAWFDRALRLAPVVAFVLRSTILGSRDRFGWWHVNPPARVTQLVPRPLWEGPGARPTTDTVESVLVTWVHGSVQSRIAWRTWR